MTFSQTKTLRDVFLAKFCPPGYENLSDLLGHVTAAHQFTEVPAWALQWHSDNYSAYFLPAWRAVSDLRVPRRGYHPNSHIVIWWGGRNSQPRVSVKMSLSQSRADFSPPVVQVGHRPCMALKNSLPFQAIQKFPCIQY